MKQQEKISLAEIAEDAERECFCRSREDPTGKKDLPFFLCELCGLERSGREIIKQQERIFSRRDRRVRREGIVFDCGKRPILVISVNSAGSSEAGVI